MLVTFCLVVTIRRGSVTNGLGYGLGFGLLKLGVFGVVERQGRCYKGLLICNKSVGTRRLGKIKIFCSSAKKVVDFVLWRCYIIISGKLKELIARLVNV